jgi:hypothetical protein
MTEAEWLACTDPTPMLEFLRGKASDRKLRLFAVACCRRIWEWINHEECRQAILAGEQFADGMATLQECSAACDAASVIADTSKEFIVVASSCAVSWATSTGPREWDAATWSLLAAMQNAAYHAALVHEDQSPERADQATLLRDIFGNPFRPSPPLPPAVLSWNDRTIPRIAQGIYDERHLPEGTLDTVRLAILADALLDAGCDDEDLMQHCRQPGPHVRGCWAIDAILGKS